MGSRRAPSNAGGMRSTTATANWRTFSSAKSDSSGKLYRTDWSGGRGRTEGTRSCPVWMDWLPTWPPSWTSMSLNYSLMSARHRALRPWRSWRQAIFESICRFIEEILCGPECKHGRCHVKAKLSEDYLKSLLQSKQVEPRRPKEEGVEQPARESEHPTSLILFKRAKSTSDFTQNVSSTFSSTRKSTSFSNEEVKSTGPVLTKTPMSTPTTTKYTPVLTETIKSTPFSTEASTESAPVLTQTTKSTRYWTESTKSTPYWIKSTKSAPVFTDSTKSAPTNASSADSTGASHGRNMGRRKLTNERFDATKKNSEHTSDSEVEAKEDSLHKRLPSFRPPSSFRSAGRRRPVLSLLERKRKSVGPNGLYQYVLWRETYRSVKEKKEKRDESKDLGSR